ncbi:hypothetical protein [Inediibacterium massiliense]|uniref:hypothetical protein n=1 Tax=Inediibacterium massiliense TaxID=1658111 RepID=UPI0006B5A78D|nr:hypothetical protein [Inediibacterium massiliense]
MDYDLIISRFEGIYFYHLAAIKDKLSYKKGFLNLVDIFREKNCIKSYLQKFDIKLSECEGNLIITHNDIPVDCNENSLLRSRINGDHCINGFLYNDRIHLNINVQHLNRCPEIIKKISEIVRKPKIALFWSSKIVTLCASFDFHT